MRVWILVFMMMFVGITTPVKATCLLDLTVNSIEWSAQPQLGYDASDQLTYSQEENIALLLDPNTPCDYLIGIDSGSLPGYLRAASNGTANVLIYQLFGTEVFLTTPSAAQLKDLDDAFLNEELLLGENLLAGPASVNHKFYFHVLPGQDVLAGSYTDTIKIRAYEGTLADKENAILRVEKTIPIRIDVFETYEVSFTNSFSGQSALSLDFTPIQSFAKRDFQLYVHTNNYYNVYLQSQNNGVLKRSQSDLVPIGYSVTIGESTKSVTNVSEKVFPSAQNPAFLPFYLHTGSVQLNETKNSFSGNYSDTITITISAH